ncbi:MAG: DUF11 domain-containing protein [Nitrospirae bacterium]|nr:DUF11 domain-containing protein [Nitrospirota bacterium]
MRYRANYSRTYSPHPGSLRKKSALTSLLILTAFITGLITMTVATVSPAHAVTGSEAIVTDQLEYMIGDTAAISGTNFDPGVPVTINVVRVDGIIDTAAVTTDGTGAFTYNYYLNPNAIPDPELAYFGTLTVNVRDELGAILASTTFLDNPNYLLQGCSRDKGDCTDSLSGTGWADGTSPMDGWTSGNVKGWYEQEYVPYRLRINLRKSSDGNKNYYIMNQHDNLRSGTYGVDGIGDFYVGSGPDSSVYPEGKLTKNCTVRAAGTGILVPTTGTPCYVSGPIYSGIDDDGDGYTDEEAVDGIDNDGDGRIDEDVQSGSNPARQIQFVTAIRFESSEAGSSSKRWALYWKAHLATGSHNFPGSSLHAQTTASGNQNVPVSDVHAALAADLSITKTDSPDPVSAGGTITYTITVTNNGPDSATNITVTDTLPAGAYPVTFVSATGTNWTCSYSSGVVTCNLDNDSCSGTIPPIYITVTAPSPASQTTITNSATVNGSPNDPNTGNNTASATTTVNAVPIPVSDLSITKTDAPDPVNAAGVLVYTLSVYNAGPSNATNLTVSDTLPSGVTYVSSGGTGWTCGHSSGVVTCTRSNLSNGATAPLITITVNAPVVGGVINNTASVTGYQNDPNSANNSTTIPTTVIAVADLSITKTDSPDPVNQGAQITYTLTVSNAGPSSASGIVVTDALPLGSTFVSATGSGWSCSYSSGVVTCTLASLNSGATASVITIKISPPNQAGDISNTAGVSSTVADPNSSNNAASANTTVNPAANLSLAMSDFPDPDTAGQDLTYTLVITNLGPNTAYNVVLSDYLPPGVTFVSANSTSGSCTPSGSTVTCNISSIPNGGTVTVTVVVIPSEGGSLGSSASVTSTTHDPVTSNNNKSVTTGVIAVSDLSITKTDAPDPVSISGTLAYTLSVNNNGPSTASNLIVQDTLPATVGYVSASGTGWTCNQSGGLVTCTRSSLAVGAAPDITITVTGPSAGGSISNTASVSSSVNDSNLSNNSSTASTNVTPAVNLSITQTDSSDPVTAGGTFSYLITVANSGPNSATGVTVTDTLPATASFVSASGTGWTCPAPVSGTLTCTRAGLGIATAPVITVTLTAPPESGAISNTAIVSANEGDPVPADNSSTEPTVVTGVSNLSITKTDSADPVTAGGALSYTITVTNSGPSTAHNVTVTDTLPSGVGYVNATGTGWTCTPGVGSVSCTRSSLAPGTAPVITISVTAPSEGGSINNSATVSANESDPVPGNNNASQGTTINASADLAITKGDSPDPVTAGGTLIYTLTVTNNGPSTATGVTVTDNLPSGVTYSGYSGAGWSCLHSSGVVTCTTASLGTGIAPVISITTTAPSTAGTKTNNASVTSAVSDPVSGNNSASQTTTINPPSGANADLAITKSDSPDPVYAGAALTYTLNVTNNGPDTATGVVVTDSLPSGAAFVSAGGTGWTCNNVSGVVNCNLSSISTGPAPAISIILTVPAVSSLTNTAIVSSNDGDPNMANNSSTATTTVTPSADVSVTKTDSPDPVVLPGDPLHYTITVTNNGPSTATGVTLTDVLYSTLTYQNASSTQGSCTYSSGTLTCNIGTMASGASVTVTVNTLTTLKGMIDNTATVSAAQFDPNMANNTGNETTNVGDISRLLNISTRAWVGTGEDREIGGFIVGGSIPKKLLIRGRGQSMSGAPFNITGTLNNPYLRLFSSSAGDYIAQNDNWGDQSDPLCSNKGFVCGTQTEIVATGISPCVPNPGQTSTPPGCSNESAIMITVPPGSYSAVLSGVSNGTGVGLIEVFDMDGSTMPKLVNISTRAQVLTGDNRMIGGFIIGAGNGNKKILLRARGASMAGAPFNISGTLSNPYIRLFSSPKGAYIAQNDNWGDQSDTLCSTSGFVCGNPAQITATGMDPCVPNPGQTSAPPGCSNESAILITVPPGSYSAVVSGVNNGTGVGLVEIFELAE